MFGDFDNSGELDAVDIDLLHAAIRQSSEDVTFDVNVDGVVNELDATFWINDLADVRPGDADFDGDVDFSDFLQFSIHFGDRDVSWSQGDFDGNGVVSFPDFLVLTREFGDG